MLELMLSALLLAIPTTTLSLYVGLGLQGHFVATKRLLVFGVFSGILVALSRSFLPFGVHIPLAASTLIILIRYLTGGEWGKAVLTGLAAHLITAVGEGLICAPVLMMLGVPMEDALSNIWLTIAGGWLSNVLLMLVAFFLHVRRRSKGALQA